MRINTFLPPGREEWGGAEFSRFIGSMVFRDWQGQTFNAGSFQKKQPAGRRKRFEEEQPRSFRSGFGSADHGGMEKSPSGGVPLLRIVPQGLNNRPHPAEPPKNRRGFGHLLPAYAGRRWDEGGKAK